MEQQCNGELFRDESGGLEEGLSFWLHLRREKKHKLLKRKECD